MINPLYVVAIVRGLIRLKAIGESAYEQQVRDGVQQIPWVDTVRAEPAQMIENTYRANIGFEKIVQANDNLKAKYKTLTTSYQSDEVLEATVPDLFDAFTTFKARQFEQESKIISKNNKPLPSADAFKAGIYVAQWEKGTGPLAPYARVLLTIADVALEFIGANPEILKLGSNEEKLVGALARNLEKLLPNATTAGAYGAKEAFGERLIAVFLRASLTTISENSDVVLTEDHFNQLIEKTLTPVIAKFPDNIDEQVDWEEITEAVTGPAASAALSVVAANQAKFLSDTFNPGEAVGALTFAMLNTASEQGLEKTFTRDGLITVYRSLVKVAVNKPELFVKSDGKLLREELAADIFKNVVTVLHTAPVPFDKTLGPKLAGAVIDGVNENRGLIIGVNTDFAETLDEVLKQVLLGFKEALRTGDGKSLDQLFSGDQLIEFARIALGEISKNPALIGGDNTNKSVQAIIKAVSNAMRADQKLLLTDDNWRTIVVAAAREAAKSPGRLFEMDTDNLQGQLGERLISIAIRAFAADIAKNSKSVFFGETVVETIDFLLKAASGNIDKIKANVLDTPLGQETKLEVLLVGLNETIAAHTEQFGHREWLRLFKIMLLELIDTGKIIDFKDEKIDEKLDILLAKKD